MVSTAEKYALEIEIFALSRGFRIQILRSGVQKRHFHQSMIRQFGQTDFFNRIGRFLSVATISFGAGDRLPIDAFQSSQGHLGDQN